MTYQKDPAELPLNNGDGIDAKTFFDKVKAECHHHTTEDLSEYIEVAQEIHKKYQVTGQTQAAAQVREFMRVAEAELALVTLGFDTYVLRAEVASWAREHSKAVSKKILFADIEQYTRDIPNEVVQKMLQAKPYVDKFVILFTDYTGQHQNTVDTTNEQIRKERDPIIFGAWIPKDDEAKKTLTAHPHLVFIGDWEDEYCDITLDKLISEFAKNGNPEFKKTLAPKDIMDSAVTENVPKESFLARVKGWLKLV